jgi:hypothetical protein
MGTCCTSREKAMGADGTYTPDNLLELNEVKKSFNYLSMFFQESNPIPA